MSVLFSACVLTQRDRRVERLRQVCDTYGNDAWFLVRVPYCVTIAIRIVPVFKTICWAYPITWSLSSLVFLLFLLKTDWTHSYEKITA